MLKREEASPPGLYLALSPREKKLSFKTEALATLPLQLRGKAFNRERHCKIDYLRNFIFVTLKQTSLNII